MKKSSHSFILNLLMFALSLSFMPLSFADGGDAQKLEAIHQNWETARGQYRDALTAKKETVINEINRLGDALISENDQSERAKMMDKMKGLIEERETLNDQLRIIKAGDVVRFSNKKNRLISFFTRQR